MSKNDSRNYGIDLLRIICMLSVVILHILAHGGVLQIASSPIGFSAAWLWEILAYPAVNCFVMISGLVGYRGDRYYPKLRNIISLFFTVLFYSVTLCIIFKLIYPQEVGILSIIKAVLPVTTEQYWFFTSYFAMFLISPMLIHSVFLFTVGSEGAGGTAKLFFNHPCKIFGIIKPALKSGAFYGHTARYEISGIF